MLWKHSSGKAITLLIITTFACSKREHNTEGLSSSALAADVSLLNVSYDPTRELYGELNPLFTAHWKAQAGQNVTIKQSHGGSGKQARSVIDGLEADIVTLALAYDIDAIHDKASLLPKGWQKRLPHNSAPYTSTIVLVVRHGNPKHIQGWADLVRDDIEVITPNPKTSGGARWNYLAAWAFALGQAGDETKAREFVGRMFRNVPVLDSGARGSTTTFVERGIGDVLIAWENEAMLAAEKLAKGKVDVIVPSRSILAEPPVAVIDKYAAKHGAQVAAIAYLEFLYSKPAQRIAGKHYYRPRDEEVAREYATQFPELELVSIEDTFGSWQLVHEKHFADGGIFDQIYQPGRKRP